MISIKIEDRQVRALLSSMPKIAGRAAEISLDKVGKEIKIEVRKEMQRVFSRPVPWTLNSLQLTPTKNHNMQATVWFKDPERMGQHYLVPQVEGGKRKLKGFERGMGGEQFIPGIGAKLDRYGNVSVGQLKQILSVLGRAEFVSGFKANMTASSAKRGKERDYVYLPNGSGRLPPGVYQRVARGSGSVRGRYSSLAGRQKGRAGGAYAWQSGRRKVVVRAQGLKPILVRGRTGHPVTPLLDFYGIAEHVHTTRFRTHFATTFKSLVNR